MNYIVKYIMTIFNIFYKKFWKFSQKITILTFLSLCPFHALLFRSLYRYLYSARNFGFSCMKKCLKSILIKYPVFNAHKKSVRLAAGRSFLIY